MITYKVLGVICVLSALIIAAVEDIKYKKIHIIIPFLVSVVYALFCVLNCNFSLIIIFVNMSLGIGIIIYSVVSRGKIGRGDGIIICMIGIVCGIGTAVNVMVIASAVSYIYLIIYKISNRIASRVCAKNDGTPFVPFITAAYIIINFRILYENI